MVFSYPWCSRVRPLGAMAYYSNSMWYIVDTQLQGTIFTRCTTAIVWSITHHTAWNMIWGTMPDLDLRLPSYSTMYKENPGASHLNRNLLPVVPRCHMSFFFVSAMRPRDKRRDAPDLVSNNRIGGFWDGRIRVRDTSTERRDQPSPKSHRTFFLHRTFSHTSGWLFSFLLVRTKERKDQKRR